MSQALALPTFHPGQVRAFRARTRFTAMPCGRRFGKTAYGQIIVGDRAAKGKKVGWFAPTYKVLTEAQVQIAELLAPVLTTSNRNEGILRTSAGGRVDFWSLENERAGASRDYDLVVIDEAAHGKPNVMDIWERAIRPTLYDRRGEALVLSTPKGMAPENFFYRLCHEPEHGFSIFHAPTIDNTLLPKRLPGETDEEHLVRRIEALEAERLRHNPLVFQQEFLAEFVDWSGVAFFALESLLVDGAALPMPSRPGAVFATVDTAIKTGREHDGTAVCYWAVSRFGPHQLILLDWDLVQIEGGLLETWLPNVFATLESLARETGARQGSLGAWIEDKQTGSVLIQQAARRGLPGRAIDSGLTALGKDERAISVSGYVYRGEVKLAQRAYDRTVTFKEKARNHLLTQVLGFRVGDPDRSRADDLLDTFCYGISLALGDYRGF